MHEQLKKAVEEIKYTLGIHTPLTETEEKDVAYVIANYTFGALIDSNFALYLENFCEEYETQLKK